MNRCRAICNFPRWRLATILDLVQPIYRTTYDGALAVFSVLSNFVLIWLTVSKILKIQKLFLHMAWNRLTTPTFWGFYGVLIPWTIFSHRNLQKAHPWVKPCRLRYRSWKSVHPLLAVGNHKQKRKGKRRQGITQFNFSYMGSGPPWTDFYENWQGWRGLWLYHSVQFWFQNFQGFQIYRELKSPSSHWLCWSSLQRYRAACDIDRFLPHDACSASATYMPV